MRLMLGLVLVGAIVATLLAVQRAVETNLDRSSNIFVLTDTPDELAKAWNEHRTKAACTATSATAVEAGVLDAKPGDHIVCDDESNGPDDKDYPPTIPPGYREVFYTTGCPTCPVGWVLVKGTKCGPDDLNCAD